jgi:hypothetical protein
LDECQLLWVNKRASNKFVQGWIVGASQLWREVAKKSADIFFDVGRKR